METTSTTNIHSSQFTDTNAIMKHDEVIVDHLLPLGSTLIFPPIQLGKVNKTTATLRNIHHDKFVFYRVSYDDNYSSSTSATMLDGRSVNYYGCISPDKSKNVSIKIANTKLVTGNDGLSPEAAAAETPPDYSVKNSFLKIEWFLLPEKVSSSTLKSEMLLDSLWNQCRNDPLTFELKTQKLPVFWLPSPKMAEAIRKRSQNSADAESRHMENLLRDIKNAPLPNSRENRQQRLPAYSEDDPLNSSFDANGVPLSRKKRLMKKLRRGGKIAIFTMAGLLLGAITIGMIFIFPIGAPIFIAAFAGCVYLVASEENF